MSCNLADLEQRENQFLAPYAQFSSRSRGRFHPEEDNQPQFRTPYQRDRDRIIHSRAFRRLEYKTQVFLNGTGDHLRTRLTHTMEVSGIARNIARALRLNEDLAETIALAHDLGHAPFGHEGEKVLNDLMADDGGFEHNVQSLRIVQELEQKYPRFSGLNLTWEAREGLLKHRDRNGNSPQLDGVEVCFPSLEAQVANLADEIAYYSHDLDDGLDAGLLDELALASEVEVWSRAARQVQDTYGTLDNECRRYFIIRCIIDQQVRNVVRSSEVRLKKAEVQSADQVRAHGEKLIQYCPELAAQNRQLRRYLYSNLYYNSEVRVPNDRAGMMLRELFEFLLKHPEEMGEQARKRIEPAGLKRSLCDYLSGMTDLYAIQEYGRFFGPHPLGRSPTAPETRRPD